jgi:hypothetical protein
LRIFELLRQLKQRYDPHNLFRFTAPDQRYTTAPMTDKETGSYLRHHLTLAGRDDTPAMMSRMSVVTAAIYRARNKLVIGRVPGQTVDSGAGRVIGLVAVDIAVAIWRMLAGQR